MKIAIAGVPKSGKTTEAIKLGKIMFAKVWHTDDLIGTCDWSELSERVSDWFNLNENVIIEGVAVPRALRKWLAANPEGKPCDKVYWMKNNREELSTGQLSMAKACLTVINEIEDELLKRGVKIIQK